MTQQRLLNPHTPILTTKRLTLRPLVEDDAPAILALRSDKENLSYVAMKPYEDIPRAQRFIRGVTEDVALGHVCFWAITLDQALIGTICLWHFSQDGSTAEVGYELLPQYQRMGFATEALVEIVNFAFEVLSLKQVLAVTHEDNQGSTALLRKLRFMCLGPMIDFDPTCGEGPEMILYLLVA